MLTQKRAKQIAFQAIQLLRRTSMESGGFEDWKDADDWIFSEMDLEIDEVNEIFADYPNTQVYIGSCYSNGVSPKDYDKKYFNKPIS